MRGRLDGRDKDSTERRAQFDHGRKCNGARVVDDGRTEAREEAAAWSRLAGRGNFRELMDGTHLSGDVDRFDGLAPVPHPGEKGHVTATVERHRLELGENADAAEDYGRLHARRGDRSQLALAGQKHASRSPAAGQHGGEGAVAPVAPDLTRAPT